MRVLLTLGFVLGALIGLVLGVTVIFWVSLIRAKRAVHADGAICRAEVTAKDDVVGPRLAGPALVRLSGAFAAQATTGHDVLGLDIRFQNTFASDASVGDQDLLLGTFKSFATARQDEANTDAIDYLDNAYSSVTRWWTAGIGAVVYTLVPPPKQPADRGADRLARLDTDLAADRARLVLQIAGADIAEIRLVERLAIDQRALHASMFRTGRGVHPVGIRNGIRATVYPLSQLARGLRGG